MLPVAGGRSVEVAQGRDVSRRREVGTHRCREFAVGWIARFGEPDRYARGVETELYGSIARRAGGHRGSRGIHKGPIGRQRRGAEELPAKDPLGAAEVQPPTIARDVRK